MCRGFLSCFSIFPATSSLSLNSSSTTMLLRMGLLQLRMTTFEQQNPSNALNKMSLLKIAIVFFFFGPFGRSIRVPIAVGVRLRDAYCCSCSCFFSPIIIGRIMR
eukprot:m.254812 g.254812  ORF g.254812 m.254812 type:complete len:105 (+) comp54540_c0_seq2:127-441(+)